MNLDEVVEKTKKFLVEEFEIEPEKINQQADLRADLGIDSLDFVDIVVVVENVFGFKISGDDLKDLATFGQFCDFIYSKVKNN